MVSLRHTTLLNTDIGRFETWAISVILDLNGLEVEMERGTVVLQRDSFASSGRNNEIQFSHALSGWLPVPEWSAKRVATLVVIAAWSPNSGQTRAAIECFDDPAFRPVFDAIIEELSATWPEAGLAALGGEQQAEMPNEPPAYWMTTVTEARRRKDEGNSTWEQIARQLNVPERTLRHWRNRIPR